MDRFKMESKNRNPNGSNLFTTIVNKWSIEVNSKWFEKMIADINTTENFVEAFCRGCSNSIVVTLSNLKEKVHCHVCGYNFFVTKDLILKKHNKLKFEDNKKGTSKLPKHFELIEGESKVSYPIYFYRHGIDKGQKALLISINTNKASIITYTKLKPTDRITFILKFKKFIVKVNQIVPKKEWVDGEDEPRISYYVNLKFETIIPITGRRQRKPSIFAS